ncbi:hypothetical protein ACHQM5_012271 [Ranunculus cassubicifolius]
MFKRVEDLLILKNWNLGCRPAKSIEVKEGRWVLPPAGRLKLNTDGSCKGNPGLAGWGSIVRDSNNKVLMVAHKGLGNTTSYMAECWGILESLELAKGQGWHSIDLECDSAAAIQAFSSGKVSWEMAKRWDRCKLNMDIRLTVVWRELNFGADTVAKKGASLNEGMQMVEMGRPTWLLSLETPDIPYFRFS